MDGGGNLQGAVKLCVCRHFCWYYCMVLREGDCGTVLAGRDGFGAEASFDPYHSNVEAGLY